MIIFANLCVVCTCQNCLVWVCPIKKWTKYQTKSCRQNNELLYMRIAAPWRPFDFSYDVRASIFWFKTKTGQFVTKSCKNCPRWPQIYHQRQPSQTAWMREHEKMLLLFVFVWHNVIHRHTTPPYQESPPARNPTRIVQELQTNNVSKFSFLSKCYKNGMHSRWGWGSLITPISISDVQKI